MSEARFRVSSIFLTAFARSDKWRVGSYFVLFGLEQADSVAEELEVFFRTLASHLRCDQLAVESRIVILLVWGQVELLQLLFVIVFLMCHLETLI